MKLNCNVIALVSMLFVSGSLYAQVGIGTNNPAASAKLEVSSTTQGFLPPRMTQSQREAISSPVQGLIIYCTDCGTNGALQVYNGITWASFQLSVNSALIGTSVIIGAQEWMTDNLNVSNYADGTVIPQVSDPSAWANLTTGAWCWYNNEANNAVTYGKLYNWYAVNDSRGLCPVGWHVPTDAEWTTLETTVGGVVTSNGSGVGAKLKSTSALWASYIFLGMANNSSSFTALPGGRRLGTGVYDDLTYRGYWWSSTLAGSLIAWFRQMSYDNTSVYRVGASNNVNFGLSVRCIKN